MAFSPSNNVRPFDSEPRPDPQDPEDPQDLQDLQDPLDPEDPHIHLAVALDGAGWHPAAWREPAARPAELFTAGYWADLVREAERGLLDLVTFEDALAPQSSRGDGPDDRADQVRGRLDAVLIAARVAPLTRHIGLVPAVVATHTEPFHASRAIATLDYASTGRAGMAIQVSQRPDEYAHFGRRRPAPPPDLDAAAPDVRGRPGLFDEAADYVEVVRRLWDSWEDDAEIRDVATGRFVDRDKLHYIDFAGPHFSVRGPSITPRPPQGQPLVAALGHGADGYRLIASQADIGVVTPHDAAAIGPIRAQIEAARQAAGRTARPLHLFGDLTVFLAGDAAGRKARMDDRAGAPYASDAAVFTGPAAELAGQLRDWHRAGLSGFRLRPGAIPDDLQAITRELVPELQAQGLFRSGYPASTLRGLLGLARPASRYAGRPASTYAGQPPGPVTDPGQVPGVPGHTRGVPA